MENGGKPERNEGGKKEKKRKGEKGVLELNEMIAQQRLVPKLAKSKEESSSVDLEGSCWLVASCPDDQIRLQNRREVVGRGRDPPVKLPRRDPLFRSLSHFIFRTISIRTHIL